jgi:sorbitol/mannitol transport system permease protein
MATEQLARGVRRNSFAPRAKAHKTAARRRRTLLYPGLVVVGVITQLPFIFTVYLSLQSWTLTRPLLGKHFVGAANYRGQVLSGAFAGVLVQTLILTFVSLAVCCVLGLGLALLLNRDFHAKALIQTLLVTPFFVMPVVTGLIWKNELFNPSIGLVSYLAHLFGAPGFNPLANHSLVMIITMVIWEWLPLFMLTLLAGLQAVRENEREAARIDGCNRWQVFRHIELPHLAPYYRMVILLGAIFILQVFGEIEVSTAGGPGTSSMDLQFLTYLNALVSTQVGQASAIGVASLVVTLAVLWVLMKIMNAVTKEGT